MTTSLTIDLSELRNLRNHILRTGLKRVKTTNEYELLRIEDGDVSMVVYKSGKVVHNDSQASLEIIERILKKETLYDYVLGSDEVGKGEWYGPMIAACVALTPDQIDKFRKMGARDSKTISKENIAALAKNILREKFVWRYTLLSPPTFNQMFEQFKKEGKSLNDLLAWAHARAIRETLDNIKYQRAKLVIDKFDVEKTYRRLYGIDKKGLEIIQKSKGESEIPVAVASILAKDMFEKNVDGLSKEFGINIRAFSPGKIPRNILEKVAKVHFKSVVSRETS